MYSFAINSVSRPSLCCSFSAGRNIELDILLGVNGDQDRAQRRVNIELNRPAGQKHIWMQTTDTQWNIYLIISLIFSLPAWSDPAKPLHEVRGSRCVLHNLLGSSGYQRLWPLWGCQEPAQWDHHRSPTTGVQAQDHPVLLDRDVDHEVGVGWVALSLTWFKQAVAVFEILQLQPIKMQIYVRKSLSRQTIHHDKKQPCYKKVKADSGFSFKILFLINMEVPNQHARKKSLWLLFYKGFEFFK